MCNADSRLIKGGPEACFTLEEFFGVLKDLLFHVELQVSQVHMRTNPGQYLQFIEGFGDEIHSTGLKTLNPFLCLT